MNVVSVALQWGDEGESDNPSPEGDKPQEINLVLEKAKPEEEDVLVVKKGLTVSPY